MLLGSKIKISKYRTSQKDKTKLLTLNRKRNKIAKASRKKNR